MKNAADVVRQRSQKRIKNYFSKANFYSTVLNIADAFTRHQFCQLAVRLKFAREKFIARIINRQNRKSQIENRKILHILSGTSIPRVFKDAVKARRDKSATAIKTPRFASFSSAMIL